MAPLWGGDRHLRVPKQRHVLTRPRKSGPGAHRAQPIRSRFRPSRATMSVAAGTVLAVSISATALVVSNDAAARPSSAHRPLGPFGLAGNVAGSGGQQPKEQDPVSQLSRQARQYESKVQAAQAARAAQRAGAARRARVLAAQRRAAAQRAAAERAAQQPPAPTTPAPPTADPKPTTSPSAAPAPRPLRLVRRSRSRRRCWPTSAGHRVSSAVSTSFWERESGWNPAATNPYSGAYGIPQALPGAKMASAGADWETNAATQIRWGLGYIKDTYGSPCAAWSHETAYGWY